MSIGTISNPFLGSAPYYAETRTEYRALVRGKRQWVRKAVWERVS